MRVLDSTVAAVVTEREAIRGGAAHIPFRDVFDVTPTDALHADTHTHTHLHAKRYRLVLGSLGNVIAPLARRTRTNAEINGCRSTDI